MLSRVTPHDNIVGGHLCDECIKLNELIVCHKLLYILWLFEQMCLQTKKCQVHQFRAKYKHTKTICEHTSDNSPAVSHSSFLNLRSSKQGVETLFYRSVFF